MDANSIKIATPLGTLVAEKATDPAHPGLWLSLECEDGAMLDLCGVEYNGQMKRSPLDYCTEEVLSVYVYSDPNREEWDHRYYIAKKDLANRDGQAASNKEAQPYD